MEWQQLMGFYFAAKEKNFTKAAKRTFRTQSALSQQIKSLEQEFGCAFFYRNAPRRISLTPEGERFFTFSEEILAEFDQLKEDICEMQGQPMGSLKFAAPFTTLMRLFPKILTTFTKKYPFVKLKVLDRSQNEAVRLVQQGEVEFSVALESAIPNTLKSIAWKKVNFVLMVPLNHPLTKLNRLTLSQIAKYPLILPPQNNLLRERTGFSFSAGQTMNDCTKVLRKAGEKV